MGTAAHTDVSSRPSSRFPTLPRHHLARPELLVLLDDGAPLTVVYGVQGYGKTTLLADWAWRRAEEGQVTVWLAASSELDSQDAFASALRRAWRDHIPDGRPIAMSRSEAEGWSARADEPHEAVLIVDDFHTISDRGVLRGLIELARLNRGLRVVVSSRRQHPIEALAAGEADLRVILSRELLLTPDQVLVLSELMGRPIDHSRAGQLHAAVGGWVSAVRIVLELFRQDGPLPLAAVREYFSSKVLPSVRDEYVLAELMRFSLPDRLDVRAVKAMAGEADPEALLEAIERPGLLERRYELDRVELHLPTLVRELLRETFESTAPDAARSAHRDFALWFEANGGDTDLMAAFDHAVRAEEWRIAMRLWREHATLFSVSFPERFHRALSVIPPAVAAQERGMAVAIESLSVFASGISAGADGSAAWFRAYAEASARALATESESLSLRDLLHFAAGRLIGLRARGQFDEAVSFAVSTSAHARNRLDDGEDPGDRLCWFYLQVALTHRIVGDEVAAVPAYKLAWEHAARSGVRVVEANAAAGLALICAYRSDHRRARMWLDRQRLIDVDGHWVRHLVVIPARLASALLKLDALDGAGCEEELAAIEDASAPLDAWQVIAYLNAQYALHYGDAESALAALDEAERAHEPRRPAERNAFVLLSRARIDLLLKAGRATEAMSAIGRQPENLLLFVPRARVHLLAGEYREARLVVSSGLWHVRRRLRDRLEMLLIDAVAALKMGESAEAATSAKRALQLVRSSGSLRALTTIHRAELDEVLRIAGIRLTQDEEGRLVVTRPAFPASVEFVALTDRERSLLQSLAAGSTRKQIAEELFISINTVKSQLGALYEKLGASSKEDALRAAQRLSLL